MTRSITKKQNTQLERLLQDAAKSGIYSACANYILDENGAKLVIARGDALKAEVAVAIATVLSNLRLDNPVRAENQRVILDSATLRARNSITFPARDKPIFPKEFFAREGIRVRPDFQKFVLPALHGVESTPERTYGVGSLRRKIFDKEIRLALPKHHLANWEDIASFIEMYPNSETGNFVFYLEGVNTTILNKRLVFAVLVEYHRSSVSTGYVWEVSAWELNNSPWPASIQILCPGVL